MKINIELNTDNQNDLNMITMLQTLAESLNAIDEIPDPLPESVVHPPVVPSAPEPRAPAPEPQVIPPAPEAYYDPTAIPDDVPGEDTSQVPVEKGELDTVGCPWDARIHAGTKTQTDAGKWKRRRGVSDDEFRNVMHEITDPGYQPTAAPDIPQVPPAPDAATAGFGESGDGSVGWAELVQKVMSAKVQEQITQDQVDQVVTGLGLEGGFNAMASRPELYPQFMIELNL